MYIKEDQKEDIEKLISKNTKSPFKKTKVHDKIAKRRRTYDRFK